MIYNQIAALCTRFTDKFILGDYSGEENLKSAGSKIIIANHSSYIDHFVVGTILKKVQPNQKVYFLTKQESFEGRISKWWHENMNCIPIAREGNVTPVMMKLKKILQKENAIIVIYPEGTRTVTGKIYLGKQGAELLSYMARVPIIPLGMHGLFDVLPRKTRIPHLKRVDVQIGSTVFVTKDDKNKLQEISDNNMRIISTLAGEQMSEKRVGEFINRVEMIEELQEVNEKGLRNYPHDTHLPTDYFNRAIYIGNQLLLSYELSEKERMIVLIEMARARARLALESGIFSVKGLIKLVQFKSSISRAKQIDDSNPELLYLEANYYQFKKNNKKFIACLEKAIKISPYNIKYILLLCKAYYSVGKTEEAIDMLLVLGQTPADSQVDQRRKLEGLVILMRLDPTIEKELYYGKEAI